MVDRVDLCTVNGKTYFRVVDYKTGRKDFDYADILNGEGLQMLIYLFALQKYGKERYGRELLPAGVLYVPAREDMQFVRYEACTTPEGVEQELQRLTQARFLTAAQAAAVNRT